MGKQKTRYMARSRLRSERLKQNWLASDFAKRVAISRAALSAIELRRYGVSEKVGLEIARVLHVEFDDLFETIAPSVTEPEDEEAVLVA